MTTPDPFRHQVERRAFLRLSAAAALGLAWGGLVPGLLPAAEPAAAISAPPSPAPAPGRSRAMSLAKPAEHCLWIQLAGGMSHLDTVDPKPGRAVMGPSTAIASNVDGIQVGSILPRLARRMDRLAVVRSLTSNQGAHEQAEYLMRTGFILRGTVRHPALGAWCTRTASRLEPTMPGYVAINPGSQHPGAGFLAQDCAPLPISDPTQGLANARRPGAVDEARFTRRLDLLKGLDQGRPATASTTAYDASYRDAVALMRSPDLAAFDLAAETPETTAAYGENPFGRGLLLSRRLIEHRVRFCEVTLGGWDSHDDHFDRIAAQAEVLDQGLAALIDDLVQRGLYERTLIVVATEFGRTPRINSNQGRDHHPACYSGLLGGGPIRTGQAYGASDADGDQVATDEVTIPDFLATAATALGLPLDQTITSGDGRPFQIADKGRPVARLLRV